MPDKGGHWHYGPPAPWQDAQYAHPQCPVPVLQSAWEFGWLLGWYRHRRPQRVLEIGSYQGGTLWHWLRWAAAGTTIISVDDQRHWVERGERQDPRSRWATWVPSGTTFHALRADSTSLATMVQVRALLPHGETDFLLLDGGHDLATIAADWQHYTPLVSVGGVIVLHDIGSPPLPAHRRPWTQAAAGPAGDGADSPWWAESVGPPEDNGVPTLWRQAIGKGWPHCGFAARPNQQWFGLGFLWPRGCPTGDQWLLHAELGHRGVTVGTTGCRDTPP